MGSGGRCHGLTHGRVALENFMRVVCRRAEEAPLPSRDAFIERLSRWGIEDRDFIASGARVVEMADAAGQLGCVPAWCPECDGWGGRISPSALYGTPAGLPPMDPVDASTPPML